VIDMSAEILNKKKVCKAKEKQRKAQEKRTLAL
jgi:hypothetical protein